MGRPKQLIIFEGCTLLERAVTNAASAGCDPVIVVLGASAAEIQAALAPGLPATIVINERWASGLASSLVTGLRALEHGSCDGMIVTLMDQPEADGALLKQLIATFRAGARIVATGYDGMPGVPALFGKEHIEDLLHLTGDGGAAAWLRARGDQVTVVAPLRTLTDLDTPADLQRLATRDRLR